MQSTAFFCKQANDLYVGQVLPEGFPAAYLSDITSPYSLSQKHLLILRVESTRADLWKSSLRGLFGFVII